MKTSLLALLGACGLVVLGAEAWAWQTNVSGTAGGGVFNATAVDGAGNVVAAGTTNNTDTCDDFTVVKLNGVSGAELWRQVIRGNDRGFCGAGDAAYAVAVDGAGNVVAGGSIYEVSYPGRFAVVKLDGASGGELWRIVIGEEGGSAAYSVAVDGAGNVVAAGTTVKSSGGPIFSVVKVDGASGAVLWSRNIDDVGASESAYAVALDGAGDVVTAGRFAGPQFVVIKFDGASGTELWRQVIQGGVAKAVAVDGAGNVAAVGSITTINLEDFTVIKFSGISGVELWRQVIDSNDRYFDQANALAIDGAGNVAAAGVMTQTPGGAEFAVIKFDGASGTEVWRQVTFGCCPAGGEDGAKAVAVDGAGNVVAAGVLTQNSSQNFAVIKFDGAGGTEVWRQVILSASDTSGQAHSVKVDGDGNVIAAGVVSNLATVAKLRGTDGGDFTPPDTEPPTATITAPANGAIVSGTITVSADACDNVGVAGVQFQLDGAPLDAEDTAAPYTVAWDTSTAAIGQHTLTAVARDAAGNRGTAAPVTVTVVNLPALPGL